jgi:hypothetical protein
MKKYKLVTDFGKPDEKVVIGDSALKKELMKLKSMADSGDYAQADTWIYDEKGKDITGKMFKKLKVVD